ncbi:WD repeat-containing protein on Y chromosome isoform X2 [Halyomorpha halys]|nr:WD repeat-containing protein on Y chromosome isoform X2 [Halyomorpha halys]XP_024216151.1 WD repeat-containing protein on Y chromosome isoform X2 [Halyomorpha halys]
MIDLDMDGMITWEDFISYLNQELKERQTMANGVLCEQTEPPIYDLPKFVRNLHGHIISSVAFWPAITKDKKKDYSAGRFITTSKDGYVDFWNLDMKHLYSSTAFTSVPLKIASTCITKIVAMADINMICVCSMDREIRIYDAIADNFRLRTVINDFRHGLVTMEYQFYDTDSIKSWLAVGDTQGNIIVFMFSQNAARTIFSQVIGLPFIRVRYHQIQMGALEGVQSIEFPKVHPTWIETMFYCEKFQALVTTCNNPKNAVVVLNVFNNTILATIDVAPGVTVADIMSRDKDEPWAEVGVYTQEIMQMKKSRFSHYLVTAGYDTDIRIWDLDSPAKPKSIIEGKTSKTVALIVDEDNHQNPWIYTYAREGKITVWDARSKSSLQVYEDNLDKFGPYSPLTFCYNPHFKVLVFGAFKLCRLKLGRTFNKDYTAGYAHDREITVALYNYLYDVLITCCSGSVITKWNAFTGEKMYSWVRAHAADALTETISYGITSGTFNPDQSLLATGAVDGSIKMWNFHTGTCLRRMELLRGAVLKVIWLKTRFFGIGFDSTYREWEPTVTGRSMKELPKKWHRTVTAACFIPPVTIIIGDAFGELLFCNYSSGKVYKRYYVHEPFRDLTMDIDYEAEQRSIRTTVFDKRRHYNVGGVATTSIHYIHYLRKRPQDQKEGNIMVSLDTGVIQLWSAHPKGALVASFYAMHKMDDYIVRIETDNNDDYLFTGSSEGYLKLWLMQNFATKEKTNISVPKLRLQFAFLAKTKWNTRAKRGVSGQSLPLLLNSYRAHGMAITSIIFIDFCRLVITSGCDRSVRYWSMSGQFLNQLGSILPWTTIDPTTIVQAKKLIIPPDLKRVMSSTTMKVLTNGYRLTEEGEVELVSSELKATAHIKRRTTERKPHGQNLGPLIARHLKVPEIFTKPAVAPPIGEELDVLSHLQPYKMEKVKMMEVPECLQAKVKALFMDSLEYMGVMKNKKTTDKKWRTEPTLETLKTKIRHDMMKKKVDMLVEEDLHPYDFGCRVRGAMRQNENESSMVFLPSKNLQPKYFNDPKGKFLWSQKRFETERDQEFKRERMKEMAALIRDHHRKESEQFRIRQDMERGRRYLGNNLLNRKMRIGRMKSTVSRLKALESKMAKITGMDEKSEEKKKTLKEKIDKLQDIALHDFTMEHKKAVGDRFWKPLFGKEED